MGQKRKRPVQTPPKDFVQSKSRVGQKKRQAANQTRVEVRAKVVKVGEQTNITRYGSKGSFVTSRNLTLEEVMARVREIYVSIGRIKKRGRISARRRVVSVTLRNG